MALPLSPITKQFNIDAIWINPIFGNVNHYSRYSYSQFGWKQLRPIDRDLPYTLFIGRTLSPPAGADTWNVEPGSFPALVGATNQARAKFVDKLGQSSQLGSTLTAELKSSWATVSGGITNSLLAAREVKRGRLFEAAKILGFHPPVIVKNVTRKGRNRGSKFRKTSVKREFWVMPGGRHVAKSLGNKWLWYSYGVKPLCQDMYNAMDVLVRHVPEARVSGTGSAAGSLYVGGFYQLRYSYKASVRISANVRVENSNLWLANQLGLINPIQMFNEGVRLSFVVDWFSNWSQFISQLTDFAGLEIRRPITFSKHFITSTEFHPDYGITMAKERIDIKRTLVVPSVKLVFAYERPNWQRGLNAISLLVGLLKKEKY